MNANELDACASTLRQFLMAEFLERRHADRHADASRWAKITQVDYREIFTPKGKLAFEDFEAWITFDDGRFAASWASFLLPGPDGLLGTMTSNEAWLSVSDERSLFEFACELMDCDPLGKFDHTEMQRTWLWAVDPEPKGSNLKTLKLLCDRPDGAKFSMIRTHKLIANPQ